MEEQFLQQAQELVQQMTLKEIFSQLRHDAPSIPRLGIPAYNWWNEGLHGSARAGTATVFPQAIALASLFDPQFLQQVAEVVSTEQRAKYNISREHGDTDIYKGLTVWSPNVNIFRDPRWGRGQETYGEDPYLTSQLAVAFIKGLQGDSRFLKTAACVKHFAAHSGPEPERHRFNALVSQKDITETYLPAFKAAVQLANVDAVMGAYSAVNGEPCCGSKALITDLLRKEWGFKGMYISDCWAIRDFHLNHKVTKDEAESVAMAINAGCDLNCGCEFQSLEKAYQKKLISREQVKTAAIRVFTTRMHLGMFEETTEYDQLGVKDIDNESHAELAYEASCRSLVLLKNDHLLPLNANACSSIAVIGPNANSNAALWGNYHGTSSRYVTVLEGIRKVVPKGTRVLYSEGSSITKVRVERLAREDDRLSEAVALAKECEVTLLCLGLDESVEGEMHDDGNGGWAGDKADLRLPACQRKLLDAVASTGKPIIVVLLSGGCLDPELDAYPNIRALVQGWYPGQEGGLAIANLVYGNMNPSGRLPVTFYSRGATLPAFTDYSMQGRTYRYCDARDVRYPFGFGLSYTTFAYDDAHASSCGSDALQITCNLTNTGSIAGREVAQVYGYIDNPDFPLHPVLCATKSLVLQPQETQTLNFDIEHSQLQVVDQEGRIYRPSGNWQFFVGGSQPDGLSQDLGSPHCATCSIPVVSV